MCGIAAYFSYRAGGARIDAGALRAVTRAMALRGPDAEGVWVDDSETVGFGHRRLAIIDLSEGGAQPMALIGDDGALRAVITFNGEIYNYRELRQELIAQGCRFRSTSDTEVILQAYAVYGPDMVERLRGMFAFALWDPMAQRLLLARDPFGIKPLYWADDGETIRVASQVKALRVDKGLTVSPSAAGHVGFLTWGFVPEPHTLYREIRALPAGTVLVIERGGARREHCYFDPGRVLAEAERRVAAEGERPFDTAHLTALLGDSVAAHLVADVPVGVFLSSGIDSSVLAALASRVAAGAVTTMTLDFPEFQGTADNEVPLARQIAGILGTDHRMRTIGRGEFLEVRDALLAAMDLPTIDGANTYFISMMAHEFGLKVALSGVGGDEFFGGYSGFSQIPRTVRSLAALSRMPAALGTAFRLVSAPLLRRTVSPKYASLLEYGPTYGGAYLLRRGLFMPWELPSLIDADMAREGWAELQSLPMLERMQSRITQGRTRVMALEIAMYMRCQLLRQTDWASMAHSLEVRTPLVDSVLFEALAPALVGPSPIVKRDLAAVAGDRICDLIQDRPKTGFSVPTSWYGGSPEDHGRGGAFRHWARHVYQHSTQ